MGKHSSSQRDIYEALVAFSYKLCKKYRKNSKCRRAANITAVKYTVGIWKFLHKNKNIQFNSKADIDSVVFAYIIDKLNEF